MKKNIALLLGLLVVVSVFTSCGNNVDENQVTEEPTENTTLFVEEQTEPVEITTEKNPELYDFEFLVDKNGIKTFYNVAAPYFDINLAASCFAGAPNTGAYAIIGGEPVEGLAVPGESVENVFPTYFDVVKNALNYTRESVFEQLDFTVDSKETLNRNGYDMCKFNGTHTCYSTFEQKTLTMHYVAYATQIKENGGWAFWLFIDETDDMSNMKLLEEYAASMADTFTERNFMEW